jgi:transglutaminase-like putative cysteine protease
MHIRFGCRMSVELTAPAATLIMVQPEPGRAADLLQSEFRAVTGTPTQEFRDDVGNVARRARLGVGTHSFEYSGLIRDSGARELYDVSSPVIDVADLPDDTLQFLKSSRYCESDRLGDFAWRTFGHISGGHERVQAICDFVHGHLAFGYPHASISRTAYSAMEDGVGVCRDFAHLGVALCRAVNVPARYATGYLGDIGVPADPAPMDFSAWFEAYIGGKWWTYDARHNTPRIGRVVVARGRDAVDTPIIATFGAHTLKEFKVWTDEVQLSDVQTAA